MDFILAMTGFRIAVITIGLIGNVLTFIIFSRPAFNKNSISIYCRALAIIDCFTIIRLISDIGYLIFDYYVPLKSELGCKLFNYIIPSFDSISAWILIAFSIDKLLSMKNKAKFVKKRSFQFAVISAIILIELLLYVEIPIYLVRVIKSNTTINCDVSTISFGTVIFWGHLVEGSIIPFVIMIFSSIVSFRMIRNSARNIQHHVNALDIVNRTTRDFKYAITSISFNVMFVVLKTPFIIAMLLQSYFRNVSVVGINVPFLFYLSNYSCGIFVHLVSNTIFRREFFVVLRLRKANQVHYLTQRRSYLQTLSQTMPKSK